jgi:hypothetical protein
MPLLGSLQCARMGVQAGILGQQGRMDVEHPARVARNESTAQYAHETGKNDEIGPVPVDAARERIIEARAFCVHFIVHTQCVDARALRASQAAGRGIVADDNGEIEVKLPCADSIDERLQVRSTAGNYDRGRYVAAGLQM